jgi:hypothetical protein
MDYERMLDKAHRSSEAEILETIGQTTAWLDLRQSGKTLCYLFPKTGAFSESLSARFLG